MVDYNDDDLRRVSRSGHLQWYPTLPVIEMLLQARRAFSSHKLTPVSVDLLQVTEAYHTQVRKGQPYSLWYMNGILNSGDEITKVLRG